jgi:hypothetical protein
VKVCIILDLQEQFDLVELRNKINKLIDGDNSIEISMKFYDLLDILYSLRKIKEERSNEKET